MKVLNTLLAIAMLTTSGFATDGPIRHVVHIKFKPDSDQAQIRKVVEGFAALRGKIPLIESIESGTNVSPEGLDQGFTHCWILSFKNAADRDTYLVHADHKAFVEILKPVIAGALVVDFVPAAAK